MYPVARLVSLVAHVEALKLNKSGPEGDDIEIGFETEHKDRGLLPPPQARQRIFLSAPD